MRKYLLSVVLVLVAAGFTRAQQKVLDIPAMHQLISESETEYNSQQDARRKQAFVLANEKANLTLLDKMKKTYRDLQQRYNTLGTAINVAQIGINASPMVARIVSNQSQIISLTERNPALVGISYGAELNFVVKAKSLLAYVTGLTLAYGDVNQMKASDRKILFDYVLLELSTLQDLSGNLLNLLQYSNLASLLRSANPFQNFIDADKQLAGDIIRNAKYLQ
jgi:hypothetical protein